MNFRIRLKVYKGSELRYNDLHYVKASSLCEAQIKLLTEQAKVGLLDIVRCPILGGYEYEVFCENGYLFKTTDIKQIKFVDAY